MNKKQVAVVIPTIRDLHFFKSWGDEFRDCIGIIVEDHKTKEIKTPNSYFKRVFHYSWQDIDKELGKNSWIISRKNAGIRSFGFLKAFQMGSDITITLDDDCYPIKGQSFLKKHLENLKLQAPVDWFPTYPHRKYGYTRGFPYNIRDKREVVISHGLWSNILDFDAKTHLQYPKLHVPVFNQNLIEFIPKDYFFPMCSMNLAFKTKITPIMYFPLMGEDPQGMRWGYDRFDDIWAGIFAKKIIDDLGCAVVNGSPFVEHRQASDVFKNLQKEAKGVRINEKLYSIIKKIKLKSKTLGESYQEIAKKAIFPNNTYFKYLSKAMYMWSLLFNS